MTTSSSSTLDISSTSTQSTNDASSADSLTLGLTIQSSSPDDSNGLAGDLCGEALGVGTNTLAAGSASAALVDNGGITTFDGEITMVAVGEGADGQTVYASADTGADGFDGAELLIIFSLDSESIQQAGTESVAVATSTTDVTAIDLHLSGIGSDAAGATGPASGGDPGSGGEPSGPTGAPDATSLPDGGDDTWDLDGNYAILVFDAVAAGENTSLVVDAFLLVLEDELSIATVTLDLAVSY